MTAVIISDDRTRVPQDALNKEGINIEQWSLDEFITKASDDEGLSFGDDTLLYVDVACADQNLYEALVDWESQFNITYYRFDDTPKPNYDITSDRYIICKTKVAPTSEPVTPVHVPDNNIQQAQAPVQPAPQQPIQQAPIQQQPVQQTPVQPVQPIQQAPIQQAPIQQQPVQQQPVYTAPQPAQQPIQQAPVQQQPRPAQPQQQRPVQPQQQRPVQQQQRPVQSQQRPVQNQPNAQQQNTIKLNTTTISNMLQYDEFDLKNINRNRKAAPATVVLFGSSKGGTGKTFTCLATAYQYAKMYPEKKIALADFDIIDGQVGITLNKITPTLAHFYQQHAAGNKDFDYLENCKVKSENFNSNIDFYLAPPQDIAKITNDTAFWKYVFELLIKNYDIVFFDSGIDYLGKEPISMLYKIADKIFITCNPSINSVKSVIKQIKSVGGTRVNLTYSPGDHIVEKINIVLTRVYNDEAINKIVTTNLTQLGVKICAMFGNIDSVISQIQWYQSWKLLETATPVGKEGDFVTVIPDELSKICKEIG